MDASPSICFLSRQPDAAVVNVLSVVNVGESVARWTFDTAVTAHPTIGGGLNSGTDVPVNYVAFTTFTLDCEYPSAGNPGDTWHVDLPTTGVTFAGGKLLTAQSGVIS